MDVRSGGIDNGGDFVDRFDVGQIIANHRSTTGAAVRLIDVALVTVAVLSVATVRLAHTAHTTIADYEPPQQQQTQFDDRVSIAAALALSDAIRIRRHADKEERN